MTIGGKNNRVAGRDYYECTARIELTPEQLKMLAIVSCPRCQQRFIQPGIDLCNHCRAEIESKADQDRGALALVFILFIWGALLSFCQKFGMPIQPKMFFCVGAASVAIAFMLFLVFALVQDYLKMSGRVQNTDKKY